MSEAAPRLVPVTTWYLEMHERAALRPAAAPRVPATIVRAEIPSPALSRFLYTSVGGDWHWRDRLPWTWAQWQQWLDRPQLQTWVLQVRGTPAGYVELEAQSGGDVEIAYFGIAPPFFGQGLGGHLLGEGIARAWDLGARRVWVHTCSLDHPAALSNYRSRGMALYREETQLRPVPARSAGPWPGATP
ncbi:MAG TPA: GNAT family N-acetyltransferase [Candidatus Binatia bacterium]|nr:GNAT family N-acetyltransferase [Candidatus Binatia bacterium]